MGTADAHGDVGLPAHTAHPTAVALPASAADIPPQQHHRRTGSFLSLGLRSVLGSPGRPFLTTTPRPPQGRANAPFHPTSISVSLTPHPDLLTYGYSLVCVSVVCFPPGLRAGTFSLPSLLDLEYLSVIEHSLADGRHEKLHGK